MLSNDYVGTLVSYVSTWTSKFKKNLLSHFFPHKDHFIVMPPCNIHGVIFKQDGMCECEKKSSLCCHSSVILIGLTPFWKTASIHVIFIDDSV